MGLSERFGSWKGAHNRLREWAPDGTWEKVFTALLARADAEGDLDTTKASDAPVKVAADVDFPEPCDLPSKASVRDFNLQLPGTDRNYNTSRHEECIWNGAGVDLFGIGHTTNSYKKGQIATVVPAPPRGARRSTTPGSVWSAGRPTTGPPLPTPMSTPPRRRTRVTPARHGRPRCTSACRVDASPRRTGSGAARHSRERRDGHVRADVGQADDSEIPRSTVHRMPNFPGRPYRDQTQRADDEAREAMEVGLCRTGDAPTGVTVENQQSICIMDAAVRLGVGDATGPVRPVRRGAFVHAGFVRVRRPPSSSPAAAISLFQQRSCASGRRGPDPRRPGRRPSRD